MPKVPKKPIKPKQLDYRTPEFYVNRIIKRNAKREYLRCLERRHSEYSNKRFVEGHRGLEYHDMLFAEVPSLSKQPAKQVRTVLQLLRELSLKHPKSYVLDILEEGTGEGQFFRELIPKLAEAGIKARATGMNLTENERLRLLQRAGFIDNLVIGPAEYHAPKPKSYDVIFSLMGSIYYTKQVFRKDLLLKYAYALKEHGEMYVAFSIVELDAEFGPKGGLSPNQSSNLDSEIIKKQMEDITTAFRKRGFIAEFYSVDKLVSERERDETYTPDYVLKVNRMSDAEYANENAQKSRLVKMTK